MMTVMTYKYNIPPPPIKYIYNIYIVNPIKVRRQGWGGIWFFTVIMVIIVTGLEEIGYEFDY